MDAPVRLVLTGKPWKLRFPNLCACCGATVPTHSTLPIEKLRVYTDSDGPTTYSVETLRVPFCQACVGRHQAEVRPMSLARRMLHCLRAPVWIAGVGASFVLYITVPALVEQLFRGDYTGVLLYGALVAFFALIAVGSFWAAWRETRRYCLTPPTSITSAFDYSADVSELFDGERRQYTLANAEFAEALRYANQGLQWNPSGGKAQIAERRRDWLLKAGAVALVGAAIWAVWDEYLR